MFGKPTIVTDEVLIDQILDRFTAEVLPSREEFKKALMKGDRLKFFVGADPTGPDLHIGHAINFLLLDQFKKLGHETVVLFGDFTARLGDPTGKDAARVKLSKEEIEENIKTWKDQIGKTIDFRGSNHPKVVRNSSWLSKLDLAEIIELSGHFTIATNIIFDIYI